MAASSDDGGVEAARLAERLDAAARGEIAEVQLELARARMRARLFAEPSAAVQLGRYLVLEQIGRGAMGVVYIAFDPQLDRKIALKVLHSEALGDTPEQQQRLLREARSLAKLTHPNVVALHDVGTFEQRSSGAGESVFIAMEYVDGLTLRAWLRERERSWPDVLAVMLQAARGLAAAHAASLVHRDFKPDNVMVGRDGRVRVMDFGLARAVGSAVTEPDARSNRELSQSTETASVAGTPAYMAPEQLAGISVGSAADQFSFCVTCWEALFGERPFSASTPLALHDAILAGEIRSSTTRREIPTWLRTTIARGLRAEPERRWPSMEALASELERGRGRTRRRRMLAAATAAVALGGAAFGWAALDRARRVEACAAAGHEIDALWDPSRDQAMRAAMLATDLPFASRTADAVATWLDEHARSWAHARTEACLASEVQGAWTDDLRDRASWCLENRRLALGALIDELSAPDAAMMQRAVGAAVKLEPIGACVDEQRLRVLPMPPTAQRDAFTAVLGVVSRAGTLEAAGRYELADATASSAVADAEVLGWAPLTSAARLRVGSIARVRGDSQRAELELEEAYFGAARSGAFDIAADAAILLAQLVGQTQARPEEGRRWARLGEVALVELGVADDDPRRVSYYNSLGAIALTSGAFEEARARFSDALRIEESILGPEHPDLARTVSNVAIATKECGDSETSLALFERALRIQEAALGPDHPLVAATLNNLAIVHMDEHHLDEAEALFRRALAIRERALGKTHPEVAGIIQQLGNIRMRQERFAESHELQLRALAIAEEVYEPDHAALAGYLSDLASVERMLGHLPESRRLLQRALTIREKAFGADHPLVGDALYNLGNGLREEGRFDEARAAFERALAIWTASNGPQHPRNAWAMRGLADVALGAGHPDEAVAFAERGLALREATHAAIPDIAELRFLLARALVAKGDRTRAMAEAERSRAEFHGVDDRIGEDAVVRWIASTSAADSPRR